MVASITVLYPTGEDSTFDMDYYLAKHMKIVEENWKDMGLKSWKITKLAEPTDTSQPYSVGAYLEFESTAAFQKAADEKGSVVLGDIPNFSNKQPVLSVGEIVASG